MASCIEFLIDKPPLGLTLRISPGRRQQSRATNGRRGAEATAGKSAR